MKNIYSLAVLCTLFFNANAQTYTLETVGTPASSCMVNTYSGWANNGVLTFNGNSEVQNVNSSNNSNASGGGNVFFTNVAGTNLEISGFAPSSVPQSLDITFSMFGYNNANLNELVLEYSIDGGTTYTALTYKRLFRNYFPPTPWDVMVSDPLPGSINFTNLKIRFRQTSATQQFRIDDLEANFYYTLPIKLISFSARQTKGENELMWKASSTDEHEYFVVEKSSDGRNFTPVVNVAVKGIGEYSYTFNDGAAGKSFYRLKLVDVSGRRSYSQIIYVQANVQETGFIQKIYPVPAKETINTQILGSKNESATIIITDMSGRVVATKTFSITQGVNNCSMDVQKLNGGMYVLKIITGTVTQASPVMIQ